MRPLPDHVQPYKKTATFTGESVPAGLTSAHATKEGVWGVIHVVSGELQYDIPSRDESHILDPEHPGLVEPTVTHRVTPLGAVEFYVEFHR